MPVFGKTSQLRLNTCDPRIVAVLEIAIVRSVVDFGVAYGHRTTEAQKIAFAEKKSKIDGVTVISKHQYLPSKAVDVYGWVNGKECYSTSVLCYLAGLFNAISVELGYSLRWGGNWDGDGEIITDQKFNDFGHFEVVD
jgi:hypothetical protein